MATKREDGEDFPEEAFAYVPDPESPSTWKLRLWDSLDERETAAQVGRAVAALGQGGFRGNRVEIPEDDLPGVKRRVLDAWLQTHPDETREDAPEVLKGYGYEMKDDDEYGDGQIDPLDELLDAYQSFVRMGMAEFADEAMALVHELQNVMLGKSRDAAKGHSMGYGNPIACLSQAYLGLVMFPDGRELAGKILALMDRAATAMMPAMPGDDQEADDEEMAEGDRMDRADTGAGGSGDGDRRRVRREVREQDGQFCVYSETGRAFGCYASRDAAAERLAQIESFSEAMISKSTLPELVEQHDLSHRVPTVTEAIKTVHDLISDEIEVVFEIAEPYALSNDEKLAMLSNLDGGLVAKAAEYRYTLGPAYVPNREDAHGEFTDAATLQRAMWDWIRKGDRTIYLQHSEKAAGEMVEMMTLPFPLEAELTVPNQGVSKFTFPADTPFLGVVWEDWAWDLVKTGQLRGYSIGGTAKRVEADLPVDATI
jgi:hypothetical protein